MIVYKLNIDPDSVRSLIGSGGLRLNPIQDANDNWVITNEEIDSPEFQSKKFKDIFDQCEPIEYNKKIKAELAS